MPAAFQGSRGRSVVLSGPGDIHNKPIPQKARPPSNLNPPPPAPYIPIAYSISSAANPISISDFDLLTVIGKGSFGKVLQVRKKSDGRVLAMKIIKKRHIFEHQQQFHTITERTILAAVPHPFIPRLHYAFQTNDKLYMVIDIANGGELFFHLREFVLIDIWINIFVLSLYVINVPFFGSIIYHEHSMIPSIHHHALSLLSLFHLFSLFSFTHIYIHTLFLIFYLSIYIYIYLFIYQYISFSLSPPIRKARLSFEVARFLIAEVVDVIDHLHRHHIVYRDLKPENVLIQHDGHILLVDFGLAKILRESDELTNDKYSESKNMHREGRGSEYKTGSENKFGGESRYAHAEHTRRRGVTTQTYCGTEEYMGVSLFFVYIYIYIDNYSLLR